MIYKNIDQVKFIQRSQNDALTCVTYNMVSQVGLLDILIRIFSHTYSI